MSILAIDRTLYWCGVYKDRVKEFEKIHGRAPTEKENDLIYGPICDEAADEAVNESLYPDFNDPDFND